MRCFSGTRLLQQQGAQPAHASAFDPEDEPELLDVEEPDEEPDDEEPDEPEDEPDELDEVGPELELLLQPVSVAAAPETDAPIPTTTMTLKSFFVLVKAFTCQQGITLVRAHKPLAVAPR
jgi:hypothetical protein